MRPIRLTRARGVQVAELVTIDPQQLALTWKEVVKYYQKVAPSLYELAGKRPYYNYILDDVSVRMPASF